MVLRGVSAFCGAGCRRRRSAKARIRSRTGYPLAVILRRAEAADAAGIAAVVLRILRILRILREGATYAVDADLSEAEALACWLGPVGAVPARRCQNIGDRSVGAS